MASTLLTYPRLGAFSDPSGCSLTKTNFEAMTPDKIEGMGMTAYEEDIWNRAVEARAVGVLPNTLHELLMSRITQVGKDQIVQRKVGRTTQFAPFKYRTRTRNLNMSYFHISAGVVHPTAGVGAIPTSAWNLSITVGPGEYASQLQYLARYFIPGHWIVVEHRNQSTLVAYTTTHKIVAAVDASATTATVTVSAPFSAAGWAGLTNPQKLPFQPVHGAVQILANDASDYEAFAANAPTNTNTELLVDWFQTSREVRVRNKEYEEGLARILKGEVNSYLKKFQTLEFAERNRQEMQYWEQIWMNAVFYNGRISEFQKDDATWTDINSLEDVTDPENTECVYERKAHALGIHTQLVENSRRIDLQNGVLDFDLIAELLQKVQRNRQLDGKAHDTIDLMMDRATKHQFDTLLTRYLKAEYGMEFTRYFTAGQVLDSNGVPNFKYTKYELPKQGLIVALFEHKFFEDRISAFGNGSGGANGTINYKNRGRMIMAIDWEDLAIGILEVNQVKREYKNDVTAQANPLYTRIMKLNTKEYDFRSKTWDVEFGDFNRHLIIENFSEQCPTFTTSTCEPALS